MGEERQAKNSVPLFVWLSYITIASHPVPVHNRIIRRLRESFMRWDQICLRVMLWSLAMAAAMGVAAIFTAGSRTLANLAATAATTATAAALLWPLTRLATEPAKRLAALFGVSAILLEFFLMMFIIWGHMFFRDSDFSFEPYAWWIFLYVILTGLPAFAFLLFWTNPAGWLAARVGVVAAGVTLFELLAGTIQLSRGFFPSPDERVTEVAAFTGLFGLLASACLAGTLTQRPWRWLGVLAAAAGGVMAHVHLFRITTTEYGEASFVIATTIASVIAYANLCLLPKLAPLHEVIRLGTIAVAATTATLIGAVVTNSIFNYYNPIDDALTRWAGAGGIVTACGTVAILILALVHRSHAPKAFVDMPWVEMAITCPFCGESQKVNLGESTCSKCRLAFFIRIGERKRAT
jgi:hypothetical protein